MARKTRFEKGYAAPEPRYKTPEDLPHDIIEKIIFNLHHPYDHLSFLKTCSTVCRAYTPRIYRLLCIDQGFGRSEKDEKSISWGGLFHLVLGHADTCKEVYCKQFGKPGHGKITIDRLLKHPKEGFPPLTTKRKLHVHLKNLVNTDLKSLLDTPFLSTPINFTLLNTIYKGLEDTSYLVTFWGAEIRKTKGSLGSHPLLGWAFASHPPVIALNLQLYMTNYGSSASVEMKNETGLTVFDVILGIHRCLKNNLPRKIREGYPKNLQTRLTWYDHLRLADEPQKSRLIIPIEEVDLIKSTDGKEFTLKISLRRIDY
ncbi:hypothetical protein I302_107415 [Kwoniella bestiolae CBS 10118]|uniref:Uncharacterized protein n=1 Tax=Kwoniella bestiolae CBS 10118 TaxID=1296100 RepID=A0A1B9FYM6_9TREE|nr:hypothetical protein I302_06845 [Kwoniella bestiolae CBS 10118]OCF23860.1 hypothetical protein I302_06845 [Kwoniella bestiolae CBS 10118]